MEPNSTSLLLRSRARQLIERVAEAQKIETEEIYALSKEPEIAQARQIAMYVLYHGLHLSKSEAGRLFHRDHSTTIYALERVQKDPRLKQLAEGIIATECPDVPRSVGALPSDAELRAYLEELDELMRRGEGIKRLLTGHTPLEAVS